MSVTAYIYREGREDQRYPIRQQEAEAITAAGFPVEIHLRDISLRGFSFSSIFSFGEGETLKVRLGEEAFVVRVVWQMQGSVGCVFARPLTNDELQGVYVQRNAGRKVFRLPVLWRVVVIVGSTLLLWALLAMTSILGMKLIKRVLN